MSVPGKQNRLAKLALARSRDAIRERGAAFLLESLCIPRKNRVGNFL